MACCCIPRAASNRATLAKPPPARPGTTTAARLQPSGRPVAPGPQSQRFTRAQRHRDLCERPATFAGEVLHRTRRGQHGGCRGRRRRGGGAPAVRRTQMAWPGRRGRARLGRRESGQALGAAIKGMLEGERRGKRSGRRGLGPCGIGAKQRRGGSRRGRRAPASRPKERRPHPAARRPRAARLAHGARGPRARSRLARGAQPDDDL